MASYPLSSLLRANAAYSMATGVATVGVGLVTFAGGLLALSRSESAAAAWGRHRSRGPRVVEVSQEIAGTADEIWAVMTDEEAYARLAPNLSKVGPFVLDGEGHPAQRRCWDVRGQHWDETCTRWDPGRSFSVDVHTQAADYPYPLTELRGTWSVSPGAPEGSIVTMRFELQPRAGIGRAFAVAMTSAGPAMMRRIIRGWEREAAARRATARGRQASPPAVRTT